MLHFKAGETSENYTRRKFSRRSKRYSSLRKSVNYQSGGSIYESMDGPQRLSVNYQSGDSIYESMDGPQRTSVNYQSGGSIYESMDGPQRSRPITRQKVTSSRDSQNGAVSLDGTRISVDW